MVDRKYRNEWTIRKLTCCHNIFTTLHPCPQSTNFRFLQLYVINKAILNAFHHHYRFIESRPISIYLQWCAEHTVVSSYILISYFTNLDFFLTPQSKFKFIIIIHTRHLIQFPNFPFLYFILIVLPQSI